MICKEADKISCFTLPMRNWHIPPHLGHFLFQWVLHYLWGIDTSLVVLPISITLCFTLPMRNWHFISFMLPPILIFVLHYLWGIDTKELIFRRMPINIKFYITYEELTFNAFAYDKSSIIFTDGFSRFTLPMRN